MLQQKRRGIIRKAKAEQRAVRKEAIGTMAQLEHIGAFGWDEGEVGEIVIPHATHRILALNRVSDTIYCKQCGCWAARVKFSLVASPCRGLQPGSKSTLRLLECGVLPGPKARVPPQLVKRRRKKASW